MWRLAPLLVSLPYQSDQRRKTTLDTLRPDLNDWTRAYRFAASSLSQWQLSTIPAPKAAIPLSAEAVWKVAGLVVFGMEPEVADGGLC